jgi:valyl-tRNA synthetase
MSQAIDERESGAQPAPDGLPKAYRAADVEAAVYARWLEADVFDPDGAGSRADASKPPFVIIQPPPNVTGALHTGHALTSAIEDALVRHARMQRRPTLWLPGVDHASIAAQYVLDRIIREEGESRASLGRERYLERMWQFMNETRHRIQEQQYRLGLSADWKRLRFTMDEGSARAVRVSFKRLYDDGLAYRSEALVNWCPTCRTTLSDLEVIPTPESGTLWTVRYHLVGADGTPEPDATISVATTRPETILGDTAVAVHPDDPRYAALVGRHVLIPFVDRIVPIIADEAVQREFGTGAVKVTPAHDHDDYAMGRRHELPMITVLDPDGRLNEQGAEFAGLDRFEARQRIVADLEARGDLAATRPHEMLIGRCQRSNDIVEPRLMTSWFIKTGPLAERSLATVRAGRTRFEPKRFEKVFFHWLENIRDWNVSRQLWWGHRIPAWYCPDGHITVSDRAEGPEACEACGQPAAELRQDEDIFDTWYSSGLWPFSTLGWPDHTPDLERFYPGTILETGHDIIFFWVARMMMLGEWLTGETPFEVVYLHGMVRDAFGKRMSKTKGNSVDPVEVIEEIGADALRFALVHGSTPGLDQRLGQARLDGARNFANKLWNASRFVLSARPADVPAGTPLALPPEADLGPAERWILGRQAETIDGVTRAFADLQLGEATRLLHESIWGDFCDWYLELAKVRLADESDPHARTATWQVLTWTLDRYLRLLHPLMPFITEEIWQRLPHEPGDPELLIVADWPTADAQRDLGPREAVEPVGRLIEIASAIRETRSTANVPAGTRLDAELWSRDDALLATVSELRSQMERLTRISLVGVHLGEPDGQAETDGRLVVLHPAAVVTLSVGGADLQRDRERLERELDDARRQLASAEARLANEAFTSRAPASVVEGVRARAAELRELVEQLEARLAD